MEYGYKHNKKEGATYIGKKSKTEALKKKKESQLSKYGPLTKHVSPELDKKLKRDFPGNR